MANTLSTDCRSAISKRLYEARYLVTLLLCLAGTGSMTMPAYGAGELDQTFAASAFGANEDAFAGSDQVGSVEVIKIQPDGKILIGGYFTDVNGFAASGIARLNADGSTDTSFKAPDFYSPYGIGGKIYAIALQPDGKILVGGKFLGTLETFVPGVRRLNPDGSIDSSFTIMQMPSEWTVYDIVVQPDNKILVGGVGGAGIFRINSNGAFDNTFTQHGSYVKDIEIQPDGKILIASGGIDRLTDTGGDDPSFLGPWLNDGEVEAIKVRPDGKILVGGSFASSTSAFTTGLSLLNADGTRDLTFNQGPTGGGAYHVNDIALRPDGKIVIGGDFDQYNYTPRINVAQVNADGTLDATPFGSDPYGYYESVTDVELLSDGKILTGSQQGFKPLARINTNGTRDAAFGPLMTRSGVVFKTLPTPDGKTVAAGEFRYANGVLRNSLARFNADGSLDTSFVPFLNTQSTVPRFLSLAIQPDGKVLVGSMAGTRIRRLNTDGSEDTGFVAPTTGYVYDMAVLPNGQILYGGDFGGGTSGFLNRLNANGSVDAAFNGPDPDKITYKILIQPDGKIVIGGSFTKVGSITRMGLARLNGADGTLDNTFQPSATPGAVFDLAMQADGKIVVGGSFTSLNGSTAQASIGRLNADGTLDAGFVQSTNGWVYAVKIQPDGKILIGGSMSAVNGSAHNGLARLNSDGTVDTAFNTFANTTVQDISLQSDGKIMLGGAFTKINGLSAVRVARLLNPAPLSRTAFDYDGDGKADISVFRPTTGVWYLYRSLAGLFGVTWGTSTDTITPADYDGDGKTDIAVYRPSEGRWYILNSATSTYTASLWGEANDIPTPADYDGDGKADISIFRPSSGDWWLIRSTAGPTTLRYGQTGDVPAVGDYDGDGKADIAIFRPSTGGWAIHRSLGGDTGFQFGTGTDRIAPADYDGDGKTDIAVYRPTTGQWFIANSGSPTFPVIAFGAAADIPVPGDYDGDGKADVAIFRPSDGNWWLNRSTAGVTVLQFGQNGDRPTENAFGN